MVRRRRLMVAAVVALVVVSAAALVVWRRDSSPPGVKAPPGVSDYVGTGPRLAIIGDSITVVSTDALAAALEGDHATSMTAVIGIKADAQLVTAQRYVATDPTVVVINLGTNDVSQHDPTAEYRSELDAMVALFPDRCVVVTTITTQAPVPDDFARRAREYNDHIRTFAHVADWDAAIGRAVAAGRQVTTDGVHPNPDGQQLYAQVIRDAVAACG